MSQQSMTLNMDGAIAVISFDLPDAKVNTLGRATMTELNALIDRIEGDAAVKGLVFVSGKEKSFIAGADVKEIRELQEKSQRDVYEASILGKEIFKKIEDLPFITICGINGICLGGGTELALSFKHRIGTSEARMGLPEIMLGFIPGWGGCVRLPRRVGLAAALDLILTGKTVRAEKAWRLGLLDEIVGAEQLVSRCLAVARGAARPSSAPGDPLAATLSFLLESNPIGRGIVRGQSYKAVMARTKGKYPAAKKAIEVVIEGMSLAESAAFERESVAFSHLAVGRVSRNLVGIFFAQQESKRLPLEISEEEKPRTVGVLGAGVMGAGIAQAAAHAGYKVVVKDVKAEFVEKGRLQVRELFAGLVTRRRLTQEKVDKFMTEQMVFTTEYGPLADCDLIVEAVIEDLSAKRAVLKELEAVNSKPFVFGSNTSSLSISGIAEHARDPSRVVGIHFFNPVHKMPLVEIVRGSESSESTMAIGMSFALKLDKTAVVTADSPGFVVNRILAPYLREAAVLLQEGVPAESIDKAMKSFGMPMGPLVLLDEVGLDIAGKVARVMHEALGERLAPPELMRKIEALKLLGKKGGRGIYLYDEKGKPTEVNPDVASLVGGKPLRLHKEAIQDRLVLLMVNEAARCLEENVVDDVSQLDLAMIFGTGFPPFHGGVLKFADGEGISLVREKLEFLATAQGERYAPCAFLNRLADRRQSFYGLAGEPVAVGSHFSSR